MHVFADVRWACLELNKQRRKLEIGRGKSRYNSALRGAVRDFRAENWEAGAIPALPPQRSWDPRA